MDLQSGEYMMDKILTFDCYGTLINTAPMYDEISRIGEEHGLSGTAVRSIFINYEDRLMYGGDFLRYDKLVYEALGYCDMELNTSVLQKEYDRVIEAHKTLTAFPEVVQTLHRLKNDGYTLCMMSNSVPEIMEYNHKALDNVFDRIFLASETRCYKPQIGFFHQVDSALGLKDKLHCHIAAGYWWDIVPATQMGWNKIWVNRNNRKGSLAQAPYGEVTSLDQVFPLLEKLGF
jgi:2-haloacid dehalogenase